MPCRVQPGECDPQPMRCAGVLVRHPPGSLEERGGPGWCAGPGGVESAQAAGQCRNGVERDGPQPVDGGWPGACSHIPAEQPLPVGLLPSSPFGGRVAGLVGRWDVVGGRAMVDQGADPRPVEGAE